jgi:hypothetical protein
VSAMPNSQAGVAAAVASTSRQVGQTLGVAVAGSIVGASVAGVGTGFTAASHPAWWTIAACGLAVAGVGALTTARWALRSARGARSLFDEDEARQRRRAVPAA